jgi:antitoxin YefM
MRAVQALLVRSSRVRSQVADAPRASPATQDDEEAGLQIDRVCEDPRAIIITCNRGESMVMLSLEEFKALEETAYLLRSPATAKRLLGAIERLAQGFGLGRRLLA